MNLTLLLRRFSELIGVCAVSQGGTGAADAATARANLGAAADADLASTDASVAALVALEATTVHTTDSYDDPSWIASLAGSKIDGDIPGNAASITGSITTGQVTGLDVALANTPKLDAANTYTAYPQTIVTTASDESAIWKVTNTVYGNTFAIANRFGRFQFMFNGARTMYFGTSVEPAVNVQSVNNTTQPVLWVSTLTSASSSVPPVLQLEIARAGVNSPQIQFRNQTTASAGIVTAGNLRTVLANGTLATFAGRMLLEVVDSGGTREAIRAESDGTKALIGFYGHAAVAQGAAIVDADGTLADLTTKFNALLAYLRSRGDIAT